MKLDTLDPAFRAKIETLISELLIRGIKVVATSCRRTIKEQDALYAQGRTTPGSIVTKAKGGQSAHNFGLACDLCPLDPHGHLWWNAPDDVWNVMHLIGEQLGLTAGYDFKTIKDSPHFEHPGWKIQQALWYDGKINVG